MGTGIDLYLNQEEKKVRRRLKLVIDLRDLKSTEFPSLDHDLDNRGEEIFIAKEANPQVTGCEVTYNFDDHIVVWPFLTTKTNVYIYSSPPSFIVGWYSQCGKPVLDADWGLRLTSVGVPDPIVLVVSKHINDMEKQEKK